MRGKKCNYYHDPHEILSTCKKNNIDKTKLIEILDHNVFNFTSGSWLYTTFIRKNSNKSMRHIGGRSTIAYDIEMMKTNADNYQNEIVKRRAQLIHDSIILCLLLQQGLMEDYNFLN
jgi:hypothetical protein